MSWFFCLPLLFPLLFTLVRALPARIMTRDVSSDLLSNLDFFSQYAAAAYCPGNNVPGSNASITCSTNNCPLVQGAATSSLLQFQNIGIGDATGFVAVDDTHQLVVISFRGSESVGNWLANLDFDLTPWSICTGCSVHNGFFDSWTAIKPSIATALTAAKSVYPAYQIVAVGHSLGGALATLAAADLRTEGYDVALYSYGSPMTANEDLGEFVTNQAGGNYRVTHAADIVPKLPGYILDYRHVSPEYWIQTGDVANVTASDISVSYGTLDEEGNGGTIDDSVTDHKWYFGPITACDPKGVDV